MFTKKTALAAALVLGTATVAFAYATNPAVQARQQAMQTFGASFKTLMPMMQGKMAFDATAAQAALAAIDNTAGEIPTLFQAHEKDPESEAKDTIWDNWDDFAAKAGALKTAADAAVAANVDSLESLQTAMGPVADACKACHSVYKAQ